MYQIKWLAKMAVNVNTALLSMYFMEQCRFNDITNRIRVAILERMRRKKRFFKMIQLLQSKILKEKVWSYPKNLSWWQVVVPEFTDDQWKANFRVERSTFNYIVSRVGDQLRRVDTNYRKCIAVEKRIAMCLFMLSSSAELRVVAELFGTERSTLSRALHEFCYCIIKTFMKTEIMMPTKEADVCNLMEDFEKSCGFPQCFGVIDGTHIEVSPPKENACEYYNYKGCYSMVLLAVCDSKYKFWFINVGFPGSNDDAFIYSNSTIFKFLQQSNRNFAKCSKIINNVRIPPQILGDAAFPLQSNLMTPYHGITNNNSKCANFNYRHACARSVIEIAFARLKARFQLIAKRNKYKISNVCNLIKACCVLHNLCEKQNDVPLESWLNEVKLDSDDSISSVGNENVFAHNVRDCLADYLTNEYI